VARLDDLRAEYDRLIHSMEFAFRVVVSRGPNVRAPVQRAPVGARRAGSRSRIAQATAAAWRNITHPGQDG
jgi:hypothetical protein